jgi:ligand-binding sensor domain-containing protein
LPSKPFDIGNSTALIKPLESQKFDWDSVPDTIFNKNSLPMEELKFKTKILGQPKKIKAGMPEVKPGATRGLMDYGINAGLPGVGRCFLHDKNGLMWIGTDKGLVRYDGENLEIYGSGQGLFDENIVSIMEDRKGRIWVGTNSGKVQVIDREADLISVIETNYEKGAAYSMMQDSSGQVWIVQNQKGVLIVNEVEGKVRKFSRSEGLNTDFTVRIVQDHNGLIWITTTDGVNIIDGASGKNKKLKQANGLSAATVYTIMEDKNQRMWLAGDGGQGQVIDFDKRTISFLGRDQGMPKMNFVSSFLQDSQGLVWMGDNKGGVTVFNEKESSLQRYKISDEIATNANLVLNLNEDKNGIVWVGSFSMGTCFIDRNNGRPGNFTIANGLGSNAVWSILQSKNGLIWMGTVAGIDIYDPAKGVIKHIGKAQGLLNDRSVTIKEDRQGRIWACGNEFGISIIDVEEGTITTITNDDGLFSNDNASLLEDKDGQLWVGSGSGIISIIDPDKRTVRKVINLPEFIDKRLNTLYKDRSGQLWLGSIGGGIAVIDSSRTTIKKLNADLGLISNEVNAFIEDSKGNMWIGEEKGIQVMDQKKYTLTNFTEQEGLSANGVYTLNNRKGMIYAGTARGFTIFNPSTSHVNNPAWKISYIGREQGLTSLDVAQNSSAIINGGQLWVGIEENILTIIDDIKIDTVAANSYITGINILGRTPDFL